MTKMKNSIIAGVVLIIVSGLFAKFVFDDKAELRYVVSDRIPTNFFDGKESESIQQIDLLNTGDTELKRIIVKIKADVLDYSIQKVANSDSVVVSNVRGLFELVYPQMPPEGAIKIIIKSAGGGIENYDIDVKHSKGSAKQALEVNDTLNYIGFGLIALYFALVIYGLIMVLTELIASRVYYNPYDGVLKKSKPWYVPLGKWEKFREDSLKHVFDRDYSLKVNDTLYYQILDTEKQRFIADNEWPDLKLSAQKELIHHISKNVNQGFSWKIKEFIALKKPKYIDGDVWGEIRSLIGKAYVASLVLSVNDYCDQSEIDKLIENRRPEMVDEGDWEKYTSFLNKFKSLEERKVENDFLREEFRKILWGEPLLEKPERLSADEWERLKKVEMSVFEKSEQTKKDLLKISRIESEILPLKEKLDKQLKIIHEVLNDPTAIDRIEDYANPFNKGNFDNLKRIAQLRRDA